MRISLQRLASWSSRSFNGVNSALVMASLDQAGFRSSTNGRPDRGNSLALQPRRRRAPVQEAENRIAPPAFLEEWVQAGRIQGFRPAEGGLRQANGLRRWALLPSNPLAVPS